MLLSVSLVRKADKWTFHRGVSLNFQTFERIGIPGLPIVWNSRFYAALKYSVALLGADFLSPEKRCSDGDLNATLPMTILSVHSTDRY